MSENNIAKIALLFGFFNIIAFNLYFIFQNIALASQNPILMTCYNNFLACIVFFMIILPITVNILGYSKLNKNKEIINSSEMSPYLQYFTLNTAFYTIFLLPVSLLISIVFGRLISLFFPKYEFLDSPGAGLEIFIVVIYSVGSVIISSLLIAIFHYLRNAIKKSKMKANTI